MIEIIFERGNVQDGALCLVAVDAARPFDVFGDRACRVAQVIIDEETCAFRIV
jgi:hypothetical protein